MTYGITGATGNLGNLVVEHLLKLGVSAKDIVAVVRSRAKASSLEASGVSVRVADYDDSDALGRALAGVDRLLLISGSQVGVRVAQHKRVLDAAGAAGVSLLAYTSIARADSSGNPLAEDHRRTEDAIRSSGLPFVLLRNNWYTENYADDVRRAAELGFVASAAGSGLVGSALRTEYAEAAARTLISEDLAGKTLELSGSLWDFSEFAAQLSSYYGRTIQYLRQSPAERREVLAAAGLPTDAVEFVLALELSIAAGDLAVRSSDFASLLGREPLGLGEGIAALH